MVIVISKWESCPPGFIDIDTTSRGPFRDLSPFYLGPYAWRENNSITRCLRMENLWQYSKVYKQYIKESYILPEYFVWRNHGFSKQRATRYPMGKGSIPVFTFWKGEALSYIQARCHLYIPAYGGLVRTTASYHKLEMWLDQGHNIALRDFDGYNHVNMGMSLTDVINNSSRPMGHAFILLGLLTNDPEVVDLVNRYTSLFLLT